MAADPGPLPPARELDRADAERFAAVLGPLFEEAPAFLAALAARRPFGTWARLLAAATEVALALPEPAAVELLDAHPRIGADPMMVSAMSYLEQGFDRDAADAADAGAARAAATDARHVAAELARLNDAYEARFGFRFVVFVAGRSRSAIVPLLAAALDADRAAERDRGLLDVIAIGAARAARLGLPEEGTP